MCMVLSSWESQCESPSGSFDEYTTMPSKQADQLGLEVTVS